MRNNATKKSKTPVKTTRNSKVVQFKIKKISLKKEPKGYKIQFWDCNDLKPIHSEEKEFYSKQEMQSFVNIPEFANKDSIISKIKVNEYNKNFSDDPKADSTIKTYKRMDEKIWIKLDIIDIKETIVNQS